MIEMPKQSDPFRRLVAIMEILRSPGGCPWDSEQTPQSITPYLIEEAFEVVDAIEQSDTANLKEELGDLLLQVVFQARMAQEVGDFDIDGVAEAISNKLVEQHPHVFGDAEADTPDQVLTNWEAIKAEERKAKGVERTSMLDGIPNHLPALLKARRAQEKATRVGFDWDSVDEVVAKVDEEMGELRQAMSDADEGHIDEEMGDVLFALVNLSRFLSTDPERALRKTIDKFGERFRYIERRLEHEGTDVHEATIEQMDALWEESKKTRGGS